MLRLPTFTYHRPKTAAEAVAIASEHGKQAMYVAGGTDLYPNMKRRHQTPTQVISLQDVPGLHAVEVLPDGRTAIGAMVTLTELEKHPHLLQHYPGFAHAVREISTPLLRNMGTIGGNLLLDTRCSYYDQGHEWRESIDFCMKKDGAICWVAPGSPRCWAVQSSDTVPVVCAMEADVELVGNAGTRTQKAGDLYRDDGIQYLTKKPEELLTRLVLPAPGTWKASYLKLRRRDTFDFPILGVGVCLWFEGGIITKANIRLGGAGSYAIPASDSEKLLVGQKLTDELIAAAGAAAMKPARTMDNTDQDVYWRKKVAPVFVARALEACK
ncbi:MAG: FAD binding domain-containing protein [Planctomycetes bacterium]|jgi:4-hydroxybenzoyl-CoA reductase subunit beta|nr:FAD binding domain-containing protein [Planctomycetota bacterium]MCC7064156.1 FAD binding domain-containing protein [Planctomycetota bacterium]